MSRHNFVPASVVAVLGLAPLANAIILNDAVDAADPVIVAHRKRQSDLLASAQAILNAAAAEERDLTVAEVEESEKIANEIDDLEKQIGVRNRLAQQNATLAAPQPRKTEPDGGATPQAAARPTVAAAPRVSAGGNHGFRHFGEFANAIKNASVRGGEMDVRLRNAAASTYGNEGVGADGGFAVPPDFKAEILAKSFSEDSLITRTDRLMTSSNTITLPTDETTPWQTSGGIQAYWTAEGATRTQSKPTIGETTMKLHTLAVLIPMTEELLEDAPAMGSYIGRKAPEKIDFKLSYSVAWGNGVGQPLGFMNSPALVTQSKESGQTADTINATNLVKMLARMPSASRRNAVWLIHPDAEPQLPLMTLGQQPVYLPPGGISAAPYGTILGRPVIPHQVCETVGDLGDIMLVDLSQYLSAMKTGGGYGADGIKSDSSMHLWFDQDIRAFKFTMRVAGQPWWASAISMRDGSNTQSPFVVLEAR